ncbi:hypothetical protein Pmani_007085 [Petrolisthes manimaculis]|uniref:PiggyBac transposable element-derived protein domain-containing protein n=1 Tax=Petrolisthes manimaculis TaxID=1843537 RepID=A0AAE1UL43_9EUCA|nr:hypothetical protein Pmani_007085 [Petrolisthes manimaculis]
MIEEVREWTNANIRQEAAKYGRVQVTQAPVTLLELKALIGILIFAGSHKDNHMSTREMWRVMSSPVYRAVMSVGRFEFLINCLRFDDPDTRVERRATDKFAPIRKIWDIFSDNCRRMYTPSEHLCVDEQLVAFRADNWFTSVPMVTDLLTNCGLTYVGTIRHNKREIPLQMKEVADRDPGSSAFAFIKDITILSYVSRKASKAKNNVMLLSSMHTQPSIGDSGKPEIIEFYNSTKGGVNTFDQMCGAYSTARKTRRWTLSMFYAMLNAGLINAWIIHGLNKQRTGGHFIQRKAFLQELALDLMKPHAQHRLDESRISQSLRLNICSVFQLPSIGASAGPSGVTTMKDSRFQSVRCKYCEGKLDRKTRYSLYHTGFASIKGFPPGVCWAQVQWTSPEEMKCLL